MPGPKTPAAAPVWTLYGAAASGSVAVEAALTLLDQPFTVIEGATWSSAAARDQVARANPMRQIPTLVLPGGEVMTECAAILVYLADAHPAARLAPAPGDTPQRRAFLRWMFFVASAIYALHWIKPDVRRIGAPASAREAVVDAVHERIAQCWQTLDEQIEPGTYLLGEDIGVLDLFVAVVSRFGPWRERFYAAAPRLTPVIRRIDAHERLAPLWARRFQEAG